jgi:hypothetical protein
MGHRWPPKGFRGLWPSPPSNVIEPGGSDESLNSQSERSNPSGRLRKLTLFERRQVFVCGLRGFLQARPMKFHRLKHCVRMVIPKAIDELIRADRLDLERAQDRRREVARVERDNEAGSAVNRCRQDVPIVDIGEGQCRDEGLVSGDKTIGHVLVHELATASEARGRDVWPIGQDVSHPLVMNLVRPTSLEQVR